jgi:hypothetical protein
MMRSLLALAVALAAPHALAAADAPASAPMSQAERRLFVDHHLHDIRPPATLRYGFVKVGPLEPGRRDELRVALRAGADGRCCVATGGFAGEPRRLPLPQIDGATANPVVLYFLEHDVREMQRLTHGQPNYFRKRIRLSLADAATLQDTTIDYRGRALPAVELRITPYVDDPMRARYERFAAKEYVFVLAAGVPGGVYQLRTRLPSPDGAPLLEETLTLD